MVYGLLYRYYIKFIFLYILYIVLKVVRCSKSANKENWELQRNLWRKASTLHSLCGYRAVVHNRE